MPNGKEKTKRVTPRQAGQSMAQKRKRVNRKCRECGKSIYGLKLKIYCGAACKQAAHRKQKQSRKGAQEILAESSMHRSAREPKKPTKQKRVIYERQCEWCGKQTEGSATRKYCHENCRYKAYRSRKAGKKEAQEIAEGEQRQRRGA